MNDRGFTLIEILISLTLLTIVLGAVYSTFFSVQRAIERFDKISLKYHETRIALDMMRREVESALVKNTRADESNKIKTGFVIKDRDVFGKSTSALDLTAFSFKGGNLNTISYFVTEKEGKLDLLKTERPVAVQSKEYKVDIVEGIESFTVETHFNQKWVRTWDTELTGKLPDIVRIIIEFDDNGKLVKLTEYARPKIDTKL
ncbi:MAG: prepilin-type N-terminal cleavage/methylation domain-containing protein [Nitrospiraceae bacterium]|nr:MAG: prepilin-type N-terminal cleavage/methylation domain-containing protein [Nitrospiraceae bacterium]